MTHRNLSCRWCANKSDLHAIDYFGKEILVCTYCQIGHDLAVANGEYENSEIENNSESSVVAEDFGTVMVKFRLFSEEKVHPDKIRDGLFLEMSPEEFNNVEVAVGDFLEKSLRVYRYYVVEIFYRFIGSQEWKKMYVPKAWHVQSS